MIASTKKNKSCPKWKRQELLMSAQMMFKTKSCVPARIKGHFEAGRGSRPVQCLFVVLFVHSWANGPTGSAADRMQICLMRPEQRQKAQITSRLNISTYFRLQRGKHSSHRAPSMKTVHVLRSKHRLVPWGGGEKERSSMKRRASSTYSSDIDYM